MDVNKKVVQCRKYPITYTLVTKQVKNINMRISSKGEVVVSANPFVPMDKIDDFVSSKVSWIVKHQKSMQERSQKSMIDDKHIILFGNSLKIRKTTGKYNHVSYDKDTLYVQCREQADPEKVIWQFLDKLCRDVFLDIATLTFRSLSDYHLEFPDVKIRDMKSRWGSCTPAKNSITLNRKLIHYPFEFIEYVVLHEFVHFIQPNHSKAFYNIIENYMPDYKTRMEMVN
ncbi:M48 family metallopeptidase [[Clostridium] innocuum]|uniref:M48 family metallopeptidase n=1 Tax=Clostridium innocuum TaxID=1522 RepID=UPI003A4DBCDE